MLRDIYKKRQQQRQFDPFVTALMPGSSVMSAPPPPESAPKQRLLELTTVTSITSTPKWDKFFDKCEHVELRKDDPNNKAITFRILSSGKKDAPYSFFLLHGAGHSAMSYAVVTSIMKESEKPPYIVAYDMRGHGETKSVDEEDMSAENLVEDALAVAEYAFKDSKSPVFILGHSMGGAIAIRTALTKRLKNLKGIIVVDVVEGTAMEALPSMGAVIDSMPPSFSDLSDAINWNLTHGSGTRNLDSALASVPSQFIHVDDKWVWRTNLRASTKYWEGWFKGLSELFLKVPASKLLILAGADRLDTPLTIGQMQGKFQIKFFPNCGHLVQEDDPNGIATVLLEFGNRVTTPLKIPHHN